MLRVLRRYLANSERRQRLAFGTLSLAAVGMTGMLTLSRSTISWTYLGIMPGEPSGFFRPFFGDIPPVLAVSGIAVGGAASLGFLRSRDWFEIIPAKGLGRGLAVAAIAGTLLGLEAILTESSNLVRFDEDINVRLPWSVLFYPVIAYVVEVVFHALPLALLLAALGSRFGKQHPDRLVWSCILAISIIEPVYQLSISDRVSLSEAYVAVHVFAINIVQFYVFRRYGFVSMYSLRLVYYTWWHIIWGYFRLQWLF